MEAETLAKIIGVAAGTFLSIVFIPPKTINGFFRRLLSAIVFGWIFGPEMLQLLQKQAGWSATIDDITAAWAIAAFMSWYAMGLISKFLKRKVDEI